MFAEVSLRSARVQLRRGQVLLQDVYHSIFRKYYEKNPRGLANKRGRLPGSSSEQALHRHLSRRDSYLQASLQPHPDPQSQFDLHQRPLLHQLRHDSRALARRAQKILRRDQLDQAFRQNSTPTLQLQKLGCLEKGRTESPGVAVILLHPASHAFNGGFLQKRSQGSR